MIPDNNTNTDGDADGDSPIRVVITPSQSSYFAGESFSVTVTFTNTSHSYLDVAHTPGNTPWHTPTPTPGPTPRTASSFKHKRASHSISSAPLARPPTSPGMSSRSIVVPENGGIVDASWWNRGPKLAGHSKNNAELPGRKGLVGRPPTSSLRPTRANLTLSHPRVPSPAPFPHPLTASAASFSIPSNPPPASHLQTYLGIQSRRELILYAYGQLSGWMVLLPSSTADSGSISHPNGADQLQQPYPMKNLRAKLVKKTVIGGGSMDLTPSLARAGPVYSSSSGVNDSIGSSALGKVKEKGHRPPGLRLKAGHGRSTSLAAGLISTLMSPTSLGPPYDPLLSFQASQSTLRSVSLNGDVKGETLEAGVDEDIDPEVPLPMFESQPSMLAVDLSLAPGESKTYTYSITLPPVLPPTFKGRCIKFSYEFSVGVCRAGAGVGFGAAANGSVIASPPPSLASGNGVSRVMKVPIRVYNYVAVGRAPRPYDLLWPVGRRIWERYLGTVVDEIQSTTVSERNGGGKEGSVEELKEYARRILAGRRNDGGNEAESDEDVKVGCREAVEIVTRNPRKVSYDVSKDGVKVAVLTFTKSAYRLGETVLGVVEFNERGGRSRVLQMSAVLEAHEKLPSSLGPSSSEAMTRVHAEQHQSLAMSVLRTTFSLDIPSDAAPAFQVRVGDESRDGGLEWRVRLSLLVVIAKDDASADTEGVKIKGMVRDGPRGEWGSSWRASESVAPLQKAEDQEIRTKDSSGRGWAWYLASAILGASSTEEDLSDSDEYDGIEADLGGGVGRGVRYGGGDTGWRAMSTEVVECTVPVAVWAGNTAFKAVSVVFDL